MLITGIRTRCNNKGKREIFVKIYCGYVNNVKKFNNFQFQHDYQTVIYSNSGMFVEIKSRKSPETVSFIPLQHLTFFLFHKNSAPDKKG